MYSESARKERFSHGTQTRSRPQHLAAKLLAIRQNLGVTQTEMAKLLESAVHSKHLSELVSGRREPNLLVLLRYARVANISVDSLIDDTVSLFGANEAHVGNNSHSIS
jgi:transcriptional regulator with XRE-family HTH domain